MHSLMTENLNFKNWIFIKASLIDKKNNVKQAWLT